MNAVITGVRAALPERVVPNAYFADHLDTSDQWIVKRTGIRERRWLDEDAHLADLALAAARDALDVAGRDPAGLRHVVVATTTPDRVTPGLAVEVAARLGTPHAAAFDLHAACAGFLYALDHAAALIESGRADAVLVCGAEALTRITDRTDRSTAVLLGDAAGAVVLAAVPDGPAPTFALASDGEQIPLLYADRRERVLRMRGSEIYEHAIAKMSAYTREVLALRSAKIDDIDLFIAHQANARIVRGVARELGIPDDRLYLNVDRVANTSSASIPVALAQARAEGRTGPTGLLGTAAFGAGVTWGAAVVGWNWGG
ncbi:beta-ketoacyl-ACP synthase 3 [Streptomyces netropsis]|uniref:beta-ketoacyl-ACP synthase 3 n=1 Tax=Streptomyces netropsis TaxID=55404 RepID=UPI0037919ADF